MKDQSKPDYLVIGSGLAGLSAAALLAKAGHSVTLLEAHNVAGGYAHTFEVEQFEFCAQVHYIWGCAPGQTIYEFLKKLGLEQDVTFQAFDPDGYDIAVLPDGKRVSVPFGFDRLLHNIDTAFPGQRDKLKKFLDIIARIKHETSRLPMEVKWWHIFTYGFSAPTVIRYRNHTLQQVFDECQLSKEAQLVLCCQAGDLGAPPEELSVLAYAALFAGYNEGAYYPTRHFKYFIHGMTQVIEQSPGCKIIFGAAVKQIHVEQDRVTSVVTQDGTVYSAERIICNMDPQAAAKMIGFDKVPSSYQSALQYEYSPAAFIIYLGLKDLDLRDHGFGNANIWHMTQWDMNAMWREQLAGNFAKPWLFISSPFLRTPDLSSTPPGCQNLEFGTLCNYEQFASLYQSDRDAYRKLKNELADQFIDFIAEHHVPNIRQHICSQTVGTPITNETFVGAPRGNCYGSMLTPDNMGLKRLKSASPWKNFFWCNASSGYPGTNGTIYTGICLYGELTGDNFLPSPQQIPAADENIKYAIQHSFDAKK